MGWLDPRDEESWRAHGAAQARVQLRVLARLRAARHLVVRYEELCADPGGQFRRLFDFTGLVWGARTEEQIAWHTRAEVDNETRRPYDLVRDSVRMIDAWRGQLPSPALAALRAGYSAQGLPWYAGDDDWRDGAAVGAAEIAP